MNSSKTSVVSTPIRDELGRYASEVATPLTQVNQAAVDATVEHTIWLARHGYFGIAPSEVFASPSRVSWRPGGAK